MKLSELHIGDVAVIKWIDGDSMRAQAIRLGIAEGSQVNVEEVLPKGPIVLRRGLLRYALGRNLAMRIQVEKIGGKEHA